MKILYAALVIPAVIVSGCSVNQRDYQTQLNAVQTSSGTVTCQHYTYRQVIWDEAVKLPRGMSVRSGDNVCIKEGHRIKKMLDDGEDLTTAEVDGGQTL